MWTNSGEIKIISKTKNNIRYDLYVAKFTRDCPSLTVDTGERKSYWLWRIQIITPDDHNANMCNKSLDCWGNKSNAIKHATTQLNLLIG